MGKAYMSLTGPRVIMRIEHRPSLGELQYALYRSSARTGENLPISAVREAVTLALHSEGSSLLLAVGDNINEADDIGGEDAEEASERLAWARRMVVKAYSPDFADFPQELKAFAEAAEVVGE